MDDAILHILRGHVGREAAITASDIAKAVGTNERAVRRIIAGHCSAWSTRVQSVLLAAPGGGFFFANEDEQIHRRFLLLKSNELEAIAKRKEFERLCGALGVAGLLTKTAV